jgi:hypothetical protein
MAPPDDKYVRQQARLVYERARLLLALGQSAWVLPVLVCAALINGNPLRSMMVGTVLWLTSVAFLWRGEVLARAVMPGFACGAFPLVLPLVMSLLGHGCLKGACSAVCLPACVLAGWVGGCAVTLRACREPRLQAGFVVALGWVASLTGAMGCLPFGAGGLMGMASGLILGAAPTVYRLART